VDRGRKEKIGYRKEKGRGEAEREPACEGGVQRKGLVI